MHWVKWEAIFPLKSFLRVVSICFFFFLAENPKYINNLRGVGFWLQVWLVNQLS